MMKQLTKIIATFIIVIITFFSFDYLAGILVSKFIIKGNSKQEYLLNENNEFRLVIFGSSRANHHYDTPYLTDSIGVTSFNAGEDGRGLTYQLPLIKSYLEHNNPELIVLEMFSTMDGSWNDRLSLLYPYAQSHPHIIEAAEKVDPYNRFYLNSNLFQYNGNIVPMIKNYRNPFKPNQSYGFVPLSAEPVLPVIEIKVDSLNITEDKLEKEVLKEILQLCKQKNIKVVGVISPVYSNERYKITSDSLFLEFGFPFIDNSDFRLPINPGNYFKDNSHLNEYGAREYTKYFYSQISDSLQLIQ